MKCIADFGTKPEVCACFGPDTIPPREQWGEGSDWHPSYGSKSKRFIYIYIIWSVCFFVAPFCGCWSRWRSTDPLSWYVAQCPSLLDLIIFKGSLPSTFPYIRMYDWQWYRISAALNFAFARSFQTFPTISQKWVVLQWPLSQLAIAELFTSYLPVAQRSLSFVSIRFHRWRGTIIARQHTCVQVLHKSTILPNYFLLYRANGANDAAAIEILKFDSATSGMGFVFLLMLPGLSIFLWYFSDRNSSFFPKGIILVCYHAIRNA